MARNGRMEGFVTYRKVIVSGDVMEVYSYEKEPTNNPNFELKNDEYNALDLENTKLETTPEDRTEERRKQTVRDARNLTRRLTLMNFGNNDKFITLTYKKNMQDLTQADKDFKDFILRFKYHMKIKRFKYIAVREKQKRGAIHYHMICDWDVELVNEEEIRYYERLLGEKVWKHGFVDIKPITHVDNVGAYIIKYMTKNLSIELYKGKKMYLCSKGLKRPFEYKGEQAELLIKTYGLDTKKEVFTNSYESEYLGKIVYKEYNMKRFE